MPQIDDAPANTGDGELSVGSGVNAFTGTTAAQETQADPSSTKPATTEPKPPEAQSPSQPADEEQAQAHAESEPSVPNADPPANTEDDAERATPEGGDTPSPDDPNASSDAPSEADEADDAAPTWQYHGIDDVPEDKQGWIYVDEESALEKPEDFVAAYQNVRSHAHALEEKLDAQREQHTGTVADLQSQLEARDSELAFYKDQIGEDALKESLIGQNMPEEFQGVNPEEIEDQAELNRYWAARGRAETLADAELQRRLDEAESAKEQAKKEQEQFQARLDSASQYVETNYTNERLGLSDEEARAVVPKMREALTIGEGDDARAPEQVVQELHALMGEPFAEQYLDYLKLKAQETLAREKAEIAERVKTRRKRPSAPKNPEPPSDPEPAPAMPESGLDAFRRSSQRLNRR